MHIPFGADHVGRQPVMGCWTLRRFQITIRAACFASRAASRFPSHADTIEPQHDRMTNADRVLQEAVPHSVRVEANQEQYIRTVNTVRKTREI